MNNQHPVIIVGAGLSGLYIAWKLQQQGRDVRVLEARSRSGGRILSTENNGRYFDLGPAWVWPQFQPHLEHLIDELSINIFKQYTRGDMLYQKVDAQVERYPGQSAHGDSWRIEGGAKRLISALQHKLDRSCVRLNSVVTAIDLSNRLILAKEDDQVRRYHAEQIILALPPRLFLQNIQFTPQFDNAILDSLHAIPTWMAGHSKIVFIYETPFWREAGLSGEAFSQHGPLSEIYDASPADESLYALTAFVGLSTQQRGQMQAQLLLKACIAQLQKLFGDESQNIKETYVLDWSNEPYTSAQADLTSPMQHPHYAAELPRSFYEGRLILSGTEVAQQQGGYLEGALESANEAIRLCQKNNPDCSSL